MSVISAAESIIGPIENWPSHIIEYLFCEIPNPGALMEVIAFCYGNGISFPMASQLYHACNTRTSATVTEHIYKTYSYWESCTYEGHLAIYYNMHLKQYVYLNGIDGNPFEPVPHISHAKIGIDNKPFPTMIRCLLSKVRSVPYY
jgi:hypothetical protein